MRRRSMYTREAISQLRKTFEEGTRVELISLYDPMRCSELNAGEQGMVTYVDDVATIFVDWDNGVCLGIEYENDAICRI